MLDGQYSELARQYGYSKNFYANARWNAELGPQPLSTVLAPLHLHLTSFPSLT